jgi:hypothetical protein
MHGPVLGTGRMTHLPLSMATTYGMPRPGKQWVKGPYEALAQVPLPAIAHTRSDDGLGHFVVLHRVKRQAVVVADPARGVETIAREEFCLRWTGYLLLLVPEEAAPAPGPRGRGTIGPWGRLLGLLTAHKSVEISSARGRPPLFSGRAVAASRRGSAVAYWGRNPGRSPRPCPPPAAATPPRPPGAS